MGWIEGSFAGKQTSFILLAVFHIYVIPNYICDLFVICCCPFPFLAFSGLTLPLSRFFIYFQLFLFIPCCIATSSMNNIMLTPQLAITDMENATIAMESLESLTRVLGHCSIYETLYGEQPLEASQPLNDSLVKLYVLVLQFLCYIRRHLSRNTAGTG